MHTPIFVAGNRLETTRGLYSGLSIYNLAGIQTDRQHLLLELQDDRDVPLKADDHIVINGHERFSVGTGPTPADDNPCLRKPVDFVMNERPIPPESQPRAPKVTFDQLAALDPEFKPGDGLFAEMQDVPDAPILPGMRLLVKHCDRFYSSPCGNVGFGAELERDLQVLQKRYGTVDFVDEGNRAFIIIRDVSLPAHWNRTTTDILVQVPQGYPVASLDMFWVARGLGLADGRVPQGGDQIEAYAGHEWQRFSWHYPQGYSWNPSADSLASHVQFAMTRLAKAM